MLPAQFELDMKAFRMLWDNFKIESSLNWKVVTNKIKKIKTFFKVLKQQANIRRKLREQVKKMQMEEMAL